MIILCDVDGTLINGLPAQARAVAEVLRELGYSVGEREIIERMDHPITKTIAALIGEEKVEEVLERLIERMPIHYSRFRERGISAYPGVRETLEVLSRDHELHAVSGRMLIHMFLEDDLRICGIRDYFSGIHGRVRKDHFIERLCEERGIEPRNCILVGDLPGDVRAARNVGAISVWARYGYYRGDSIEPEPDFEIDSFEELLKIVGELVGNP